MIKNFLQGVVKRTPLNTDRVKPCMYEGCRTNTYNSTIYTYKIIEGVYTTTEPRIPIKI